MLRLHLFSSGAWQIGHFAISSLSWEVATCPLRQLLPEAIHHHVSSKPSLVLFYGSEEKDTSREGRNRVTCLGVMLPNVFFFFSVCMSPSEHPPLHTVWGQGGTTLGTLVYSWLYLPRYHWVLLVRQGPGWVEETSANQATIYKLSAGFHAEVTWLPLAIIYFIINNIFYNNIL